MKLSISKKIGCIVLSTLMTASVLLSNLVDIIPDAVNTVHADSVHTEHEGEDKDGSCHTGWTAWGDDENEITSMPDTAGNYYLTNNVTLYSFWIVPEGTTNLCLNGHSITAAGEFETIRVHEYVTLNLYDESNNSGIITHAKDANDELLRGQAIYKYKGTINMYGGSISGNKGNYGGGVYQAYGTFNMYGGSISDNEADSAGGGVILFDGIFSMTGGIISGNKAINEKFDSYGGGVACVMGTFIMSGGTITGNMAVDGSDNAYLDGTINLSGTAVIDGGLHSDDYTTVCFYKNENDDDTDLMTSQIIKKDEDVKLNVNPFTRDGYEFIDWNTEAKRTGKSYVDGETVNLSDDDGLTLYAQWAEEHKDHDKQDDDKHSFHDGWTEWTDGTKLPTVPGYYYLTTDVTLSGTWTVPSGTTNLCLNGYSITAAGKFYTIDVGKDVTLNLYDESNNNGTITHYKDDNGIREGSGVNVYGGVFNMYGGTISGNTTEHFGGGVYVNDGTLTMTGGEISNNEITEEYGKGGGVYVGYNSTLTMTGGEISGNSVGGDGGGVYVFDGTLTMTGGEISGNTSGSYGGGVCIKSGTFDMSGGTVTGNTADNDGDNVYIFYKDATIIPGDDAVIDGGLYSEDYTTVCFYSNVNGDDTDEMVSQIIKKGEYVPLKLNEFTREGYDFNGWNTKADGSGEVYADGASVYVDKSVYEDLNLYAQWAKGHQDHDKQDDDKHSFHDGWIAWTDGTQLPKVPGYYYLTTDVTLPDTWSTPPGTTNLCLNGHNIVQTKDGSDTIHVSSDATLNLFDVKESSGIITHAKDANEVPTKGSGVDVSGTLNMYGGKICENVTDTVGGGVECSGTFNMFGGEISDNTANEGGGVFVGIGTFTIYDGIIIGNNSKNFGGGVYCQGTFNMSGGTVTGNEASADGKNVFVEKGQPFNPDPIDGPTIDGGLYAEYYTTICYFANGGDGKMRSQVIPKNTETALRKNTFTLKDCVLKEWNTKADGTGDSFADEAKVNVSSNEGLILYAQWVPAKYKITFVDNDGTTLQSGDVAYNTVPKYTGTKTPTKAPDAEYSYTFAGWTDGTNIYGLTEDLPAAEAVVTYRPVFSSAVNEYEVEFVNEDGAELQSGQVAYGEVPEYKGTTPAKAPDAQYTYTFTGWKNGDSEYDKDAALPKVTGDVTYTAVYTGTLNQYTITFVDDDGAVLSSEKYDYGTAAAAIVKPTDPSKKADAQYTYKFSGWTPVIAEVTGDATYTATYLKTTNKYTITFVDGDGNKTSKQYDYGTPADDIVVPTNVTKTATAQYTYTFEKWDKEIADVTEDATYTAQFTATVNEYTITFVSDGKVVSTKSYPYGTSADDIKPADPTIAPTAQYTYTFVGWTPALAEVTGDATYTAQFSTMVNKYNVTFVDEDGTVISSADYDYGTAASAITKPADPVKAPDAQYSYTFSGWTPEIVTVTGDATYTATYKATVNEYTVKFVDNDGTVLQTGKLAYGETPVYSGETPAKKADAQYTYTYSGWTPEIAKVTGDATYTAVYTSTVNEYTITFISDGKVISLKDYPYGTAADDIVVPADPAIAPTVQYTYTFEGWTPEIADVTGDATYTAEFSSTVNEYTIKFLDEDGKVLQTGKVAYGETPAFTGTTPTKKATAQYTYTFSGWTPDIVKVTGDATYTATYKSTVNEYTITFVDEDGTVLQAGKVAYGETPAFTGTTPSKKATSQYTYTFSGWTPEITKVTADATYTATYKATVNEYTITFVNADGTVLQSGKVPYGELPSYTGATPVKAEDEMYTYTFSGWTPELAKVTGDATYTAVFTANAKPASYYLKSLTGDGLGGDIVAVFGRTIDDANAINYLDRVESDGKTLTQNKDYTAEAGSVIITLKNEYLDTLSEGKHTLTVYFKDGQSVSLEYTVKHISNEAENIPSTGEKIAKTLFIGGACVLLAAAVAGTAIVIKKKRKKEDA